MKSWNQTWRQANLEEQLEGGVVRCHLSPRNCVIKEGRNGFCGVRGNRNGRLVTMNYGKSVHITEETIETEAVNHFAPGERILSMGNVGCMLNCVYCHNWKTSQVRYLEDKDVHLYSPEDVINFAKRHNIRVISWTYNDPVVWHEFVLDTSKLAKEEGLYTLYKSAFYISEKAIDDLLPLIDIFSISLKSIDPSYYKKFTGGGRLQPVLDAVRQVYLANKHLEISTLMVTDVSDDEKTAHSITDWMLQYLDATIPLHFVRFHPDYKLQDTTRTPISRLLRAREIALGYGIEQVYLGNVYGTPWSNTYCRGCGNLLVERYGLHAKSIGLDSKAACRRCGGPTNIKILTPSPGRKTIAEVPEDCVLLANFDWHDDIQSIHVEAKNPTAEDCYIYIRKRYKKESRKMWSVVPIASGESFRFIVARSDSSELGPELLTSPHLQIKHHEVLDRAHFPTVAIEDIGQTNRLVNYEGNLMKLPNKYI